MKKLSWLIAGTLMLNASLVLAESGTALKNDTLRAEPYADARNAGSLSRNDKLEILEKQGAWLRVKAPGGNGWVRLLSVKRSGGSTPSNAGGVLNVASGRAGTGQIVSTTGVRGLNEEELKSAKFNADDVRKLEATTVSPEQAQQFARTGGLQARKLDYLQKPESQETQP